MRKLSTKEFIEKAKEVHGNKYDYSKVEYINNRTKVCIICPKHGEFWQLPSNHLFGKGCNACKYDIISEKKRIGTKDFIERAKKIHGNKYGYDNVEYVGEKKEVDIFCYKHGMFRQKPLVHLMGCGCPKCAKNGVKLTTELFIEKAKEIHGDKYDYSKVKYVNAKTPVVIICPEHGEFSQTPAGHLVGHGCPICKGKFKRTKEWFVNKAKEMHVDKYDYSKVEYVNNSTKVCIICPKHGEFWQTPSKHLRGQGCPFCKKSILEEEVKNVLDEFGIFYEREKKFEWLKDKSNLRIDFYLPKYNIAIECQGKQHFLTGCTFSNNQKETLNEVKERDEIKLSLCKEHGIKVLYYTKVKNVPIIDAVRSRKQLIKEILKY